MYNLFSRLSALATAAPKRAFCAILLLVLVFDLVFVRDFSWLLENFQGKRFFVNYGLSSLALFLLVIMLLPLRNALSRGLVILLILIPQLVQLSFFAVYRNFVSVFDLRFVAEDPLLTLMLWVDNAAIVKPLLLIALELPLLIILMRLPLRPRWWARGISGVFGSLLFLLLAFNWYGITKFQFSSLAYIGAFPGLIEQQVFAEKLAKKPELEPRLAKPDAPNIIYIVGESLARNHMGVYGYERDTTPRLQAMIDAGQAMTYNNAVSIGTRTLSSVPYMLTGLQGIDPYGLVYRVPTIFNYAKAAGYQTALITAQDFQWRNIDQMFVDQDMDFFQEGTAFSSEISVSIGADDMKVLNEGVIPYLQQSKASDKPYMLVVQMNGSHYPYNKHSPEEVKKFLPEEDPNGKNAYDNTVLYTDRYLAELVAEARKDDPGVWVFYSTDHGQPVVGDPDSEARFNGGFGLATIYNAMLVFPPENVMNKLSINKDRPVSQADIFATILGLIQIAPIVPVDGFDLREPLSEERLRIVSPYMKTLHNEPNAYLVFPDMTGIRIDFERNSVVLRDGKTVQRFRDLPKQYQQIFQRRLHPENIGNE